MLSALLKQQMNSEMTQSFQDHCNTILENLRGNCRLADRSRLLGADCSTTDSNLICAVGDKVAPGGAARQSGEPAPTPLSRRDDSVAAAPRCEDSGIAWRAAEEAGIDICLLEQSLDLTPWERLKENQRALRLLMTLEKAGEQLRERPAGPS